MLKDPETVLTSALDQHLTGYARLEPQNTLLLDEEGAGVLTFEAGVPVAAYHTGTDAGGTAALADIARSGPYRLELYELDATVLDRIHQDDGLLVPPGEVPEQLTGRRELVERTRERAPTDRLGESTSGLAVVEEFLDDGEAIETIQDHAQQQARERAQEWGFPTEH